jgi:hypothetical protein
MPSRRVSVATPNDAAGLRRGNRGLDPLRDQPGFIFGDGRENMDCEPVGLREVRRHELDTALHEL